MKIANAMFMREALDKTRLPISLGMRTALGITAFATLVIGIYPEPFIRAVNWSLGIAQSSPVAGPAWEGRLHLPVLAYFPRRQQPLKEKTAGADWRQQPPRLHFFPVNARRVVVFGGARQIAS